jgi:hypothetical protein
VVAQNAWVRKDRERKHRLRAAQVYATLAGMSPG